MVQECRVLNWGDPVGEGVNEALTAALPVVAKPGTDAVPYLMVNELVAGGLGTYLRLPIPPFCVAFNGDTPCFISLDFSLTGERLPPCDPRRVASQFPKEAAGIIAFDVLVANTDRHPGNIAAVHQGARPRIHIYDHERCLLGWEGGLGEERLTAARHNLIIDAETLPGNENCLITWIEDGTWFLEWVERIEAIPDWYIGDTISNARMYGSVTDAEASALRGFLIERRQGVRGLLKAAQASHTFPSLRIGGLL